MREISLLFTGGWSRPALETGRDFHQLPCPEDSNPGEGYGEKPRR